MCGSRKVNFVFLIIASIGILISCIMTIVAIFVPWPNWVYIDIVAICVFVSLTIVCLITLVNLSNYLDSQDIENQSFD